MDIGTILPTAAAHGPVVPLLAAVLLTLVLALAVARAIEWRTPRSEPAPALNAKTTPATVTIETGGAPMASRLHKVPRV